MECERKTCEQEPAMADAAVFQHAGPLRSTILGPKGPLLISYTRPRFRRSRGRMGARAGLSWGRAPGSCDTDQRTWGLFRGWNGGPSPIHRADAAARGGLYPSRGRSGNDGPEPGRCTAPPGRARRTGREPGTTRFQVRCTPRDPQRHRVAEMVRWRVPAVGLGKRENVSGGPVDRPGWDLPRAQGPAGGGTTGNRRGSGSVH